MTDRETNHPFLLTRYLAVGALLGFLAVAIGAFGAHALRGRLVAPSLLIWEKASFYHFVHVPVILMVSSFERLAIGTATGLRWALRCFILGVILFSGSLYGYALTGERILALITPIGGTLLLIGWMVLLVNVVRVKGS
jgi:uncharacterized membrane protein YgdD (TMEM256/DUF423 family)